MAKPEDKATLIASAASGDLAALEQLLLSERPKLFAYVQRHFPAVLKRILEPQDVVQDTLFQAARNIGTFKSDGEDGLYRWLLTIARRRMLEMIASHRTQKRGGGKTRGDSVAKLLQELAISDHTPSRTMAGRELATALDAYIQRLPADYAQAIRLRHIEVLPVVEIAAKMGKSERAVQMLCNRGLKVLRKEMRSATRFL